MTFIEAFNEAICIACVQIIEEGRYTNTATPWNSRSDRNRYLGVNPLVSDYGNHSNNNIVGHVSTFDRNGENFTSNGNNIVVSDNKFMFYKVKTFGNDKVESTLSIFGSGAKGEKELRRAIDVINGAADRNGRSVSYRTITSETNRRASESSGHMSKTFWEFSLDNGRTWYVLKPDPIMKMVKSSLILPVQSK